MFQLNVAFVPVTFHVYRRRTQDAAGCGAEAFNLPNHMNRSPTTNLASSTFGQILSDISG